MLPAHGGNIKEAAEKYKISGDKIIDFSNPKNNDYFLASQFWITGEVYTRRPDLILFVNGLPLVVVELKARGVDVKRGFEIFGQLKDEKRLTLDLVRQGANQSFEYEIR